MSGLSTAGKNAMLGALPSAPYVSLHSADPGDTGASELSGGSPAYARKVGALAAAAAGSRALTVAAAHDVPASSVVAYVGLWSAVTAGTFYGSFPVTSETYNGQGTYQVDPSSVAFP